MAVMKRCLLCALFLLLLFAGIPRTYAATESQRGLLEIENRQYENETLSFDLKLSGTTARGNILLSVFRESGQMKTFESRAAQEHVSVTLSDMYPSPCPVSGKRTL